MPLGSTVFKRGVGQVTVVNENTGRIKVILSKEDMDQLGLDIKTLDCSEQETRMLLRALYKAAAQKAGVFANTERLLIEAYPHINGGAVFYFTALSVSARKKCLRKVAEKRYIYDFESDEDMLKAISLLYKTNMHIKSDVYAMPTGFRLVAICRSSCSSLHEAKEFCTYFTSSPSAETYAAEHGQLIAGGCGIDEIAKYFAVNNT